MHLYVCKLCGFDFPLDDVALKFTSGMVICITCFARETRTEHPMPAELRKETAEAANKE